LIAARFTTTPATGPRYSASCASARFRTSAGRLGAGGAVWTVSVIGSTALLASRASRHSATDCGRWSSNGASAQSIAARNSGRKRLRSAAWIAAAISSARTREGASSGIEPVTIQ
jgi:hypothetical protein